MLETLLSWKLEQPEMLWLMLPGVLLVIWALWRRLPAVAALLRILAFAALALALSRPYSETQHSDAQLAAAVDVSASISDKAIDSFAQTLRAHLAQASSAVLQPFAATAGEVIRLDAGSSATDIAKALKDSRAKLELSETNLEAALRSARTQTSSQSLLLFSDGQETLGDARRVARELAPEGLRLYPVAANPELFERPKIFFSSLYAPLTVDAGDFTEVRLTARNDFAEAHEVLLELFLGNDKLYAQRLSVPGNQERLVTIKTPALKGGLQRIRAALRAQDVQTEDEMHRWISVKEKSRILLLSGASEDERVLRQLLSLKGYALESILGDGRTPIPTELQNYSSIILNNIAKHQVSDSFLRALEKYVAGGGGLLLVGGDRSFGLGGYLDTVLDEMSPLKFVPPQTKKRRVNSAVLLLIDKSRSMLFENKILAAKKAALSTVQSLKDDDYVGVIGFDSTPFVIIKLDTVASVKGMAEHRLRNLTAAGQTNLLPALAAARRSLEAAPAGRKHVLILSDGRVPPAGNAYHDELMQMRRAGVTVSSVAVGAEADVPFLKLLSQYGSGAFYHTLDPSQLTAIFLQDVKVAIGEKTLKERQDYEVEQGPDGVTSTSLRTFPPLRGLVETRPKREAKLELVTREGEGFLPVLARWEYKSGTVVAFSSDANGRWSAPWVRWDGFSKFWSQVVDSIKNKTPSQASDIDFDLRYSVNRKDVLLDLALFDRSLAGRATPRVTAEITTPGSERRSVSLQAVRQGRFQGSIEQARPGDYQLTVSYGSVKLPPLAFTIRADAFGEQVGSGLNVALLSELAHTTGGALNPNPGQLSTESRTTSERSDHFLPFVIAAFILVLLEAFLREYALGRQKAVAARTEAASTRPVGSYQRKRAA